MNKSVRRFALALIGALALGAGAIPAAAHEFMGAGIYAELSAGPATGTIILDRAGTSRPRLTGAIASDPRDVDFYRIVFRSIGCAGTPSRGNRILRLSVAPDQNGDVAFTRVLSRAVDHAAIKSIWVDVGHPVVCAPVTSFVRVASGDVNADGLLAKSGRLEQDFAALVVGSRPAGGPLGLGITLNGTGGNDTLEFRGVSRPCGRQGTTVFGFYVDDIIIGWRHLNRQVSGVSQSELAALRSLRVRNVDTGQRWCTPLTIIMANTEGD